MALTSYPSQAPLPSSPGSSPAFANIPGIAATLAAELQRFEALLSPNTQVLGVPPPSSTGGSVEPQQGLSLPGAPGTSPVGQYPVQAPPGVAPPVAPPGGASSPGAPSSPSPIGGVLTLLFLGVPVGLSIANFIDQNALANSLDYLRTSTGLAELMALSTVTSGTYTLTVNASHASVVPTVTGTIQLYSTTYTIQSINGDGTITLIDTNSVTTTFSKSDVLALLGQTAIDLAQTDTAVDPKTVNTQIDLPGGTSGSSQATSPAIISTTDPFVASLTTDTGVLSQPVPSGYGALTCAVPRVLSIDQALTQLQTFLQQEAGKPRKPCLSDYNLTVCDMPLTPMKSGWGEIAQFGQNTGAFSSSPIMQGMQTCLNNFTSSVGAGLLVSFVDGLVRPVPMYYDKRTSVYPSSYTYLSPFVWGGPPGFPTRLKSINPPLYAAILKGKGLPGGIVGRVFGTGAAMQPMSFPANPGKVHAGLNVCLGTLIGSNSAFGTPTRDQIHFIQCVGSRDVAVMSQIHNPGGFITVPADALGLYYTMDVKFQKANPFYDAVNPVTGFSGISNGFFFCDAPQDFIPGSLSLTCFACFCGWWLKEDRRTPSNDPVLVASTFTSTDNPPVEFVPVFQWGGVQYYANSTQAAGVLKAWAQVTATDASTAGQPNVNLFGNINRNQFFNAFLLVPQGGNNVIKAVNASQLPTILANEQAWAAAGAVIQSNDFPIQVPRAANDIGNPGTPSYAKAIFTPIAISTDGYAYAYTLGGAGQDITKADLPQQLPPPNPPIPPFWI